MTSRSITSACDLAPEGVRAAGPGGGQPGGSCSALGPSPRSTSGACSVTTARDPAPSGSGGRAVYPQPAPPFLPNSRSQKSGGHPASEGPPAPTQIESCWTPHFSCGFPRTQGMAGALSPVSPSTPKGPSVSPSQLGQGHACWRVRARAHPTPSHVAPGPFLAPIWKPGGDQMSQGTHAWTNPHPQGGEPSRSRGVTDVGPCNLCVNCPILTL